MGRLREKLGRERFRRDSGDQEKLGKVSGQAGEVWALRIPTSILSSQAYEVCPTPAPEAGS